MRLKLLLGTACTTLVVGCASTPPPTPASAPAETPAQAADAPAQAPDGAMWDSMAAVKSHCDYALAEAQRLRAVIKGSAEMTEAAVLQPYNSMSFIVSYAAGMSELVASVHPEKPVRTEAEGCQQAISKFVSDINLDPELFAKVSGVDASGLDAGAQRFAHKVLQDFKRSGVDKDQATRDRLKVLNEEMVKVGQDFGRTIREGTLKIEVTVKDLKGMPADFIKAHAPNKDGKVTLTTDYPDFFPIQNYAVNEKVRQDLYTEFLNRGYPTNDAHLKKLIELRTEYAAILGHDSWASYNAEDKMVKTSANIDRFIKDITKVARPRMDADLKVLLKRKKKDNRRAKAIQVWDRFYYVQKVKKEKYGFDAQAVRPYFEFGAVTQGLMDLYGELFGVRFEKAPETQTWHTSVSAWKMFEGDKLVGEFFLDMHPRDGKYQHAAMFPLRTGLSDGAPPMASLVCNFPDPSKSEGPALMEHSQVVTYFHEFGHLVHHLLATGSKWSNQAGINVEWDFVEAPSQLLEEWAWDPVVLQRFAKHVDTGAPIPADLVKKMRTSNEFGMGMHVMRQVFYTALSYYLHAEDPKDLNLLDFQKRMQKDFSPFPYVQGTHGYANFGHINGYSSMYYTYQWSLSLAKDIFTRFEKAGLLDQTVAREYVDKILKPGGSKDANELVKDFLGREPTLDAYKKWLEGK